MGASSARISRALCPKEGDALVGDVVLEPEPFDPARHLPARPHEFGIERRLPQFLRVSNGDSNSRDTGTY